MFLLYGSIFYLILVPSSSETATVQELNSLNQSFK